MTKQDAPIETPGGGENKVGCSSVEGEVASLAGMAAD